MPVWMEASFCNYFIRLNAALPPSAPEQEMVVLHQLLGQRPSLLVCVAELVHDFCATINSFELTGRYIGSTVSLGRVDKRLQP